MGSPQYYLQHNKTSLIWLKYNPHFDKFYSTLRGFIIASLSAQLKTNE